jgi:hypothetical protein
METTELAKTAFKAYNVQAGGKTWDGKPIPDWENVGEKVQANWVAAINAVIPIIKKDHVR